jgi:hypothetical protein
MTAYLGRFYITIRDLHRVGDGSGALAVIFNKYRDYDKSQSGHTQAWKVFSIFVKELFSYVSQAMKWSNLGSLKFVFRPTARMIHLTQDDKPCHFGKGRIHALWY